MSFLGVWVTAASLTSLQPPFMTFVTTAPEMSRRPIPGPCGHVMVYPSLLSAYPTPGLGVRLLGLAKSGPSQSYVALQLTERRLLSCSPAFVGLGLLRGKNQPTLDCSGFEGNKIQRCVNSPSSHLAPSNPWLSTLLCHCTSGTALKEHPTGFCGDPPRVSPSNRGAYPSSSLMVTDTEALIAVPFISCFRFITLCLLFSLVVPSMLPPPILFLPLAIPHLTLKLNVLFLLCGYAYLSNRHTAL